MNPERWQAIGELFDQALAAPTAERAGLIDRAAGADEAIRREVQSLLASHQAAPGGFVQERIRHALESFERTSALPASPSRVGPYRLVREIGRGGMGTVFLAERDDNQYQATVAVKLVRPGMDTDFILARFRRERQTLARLQHPNVSQLLDGGTTDDRLPYIVMEYIDGPWITTYAEQQALGIGERLRMFIDVCRAVDYAHRNFIVHRDLKPGNILVNQRGVPKLVDFGICKLLAGESVSAADTQSAPMTPSYASPEQIRGEAATILSDVYSLGAVLYELLTGASPRRFDGMTPIEVQQSLDRPVAAPSRVAGDPRLARQLAGDLDNILLRALDPEPARRYESAARLAEDVQRYLDHEPVRARPATFRYRASKFFRRHRASLTAAACVLAALIGGFALAVYQARIADERLQQVRSLAGRLVFDLHDAVRDLPGSTKARQLIVETGVQYLDSLVARTRHDSRAEVELAKAYRQLGDVLGNVNSANLGHLPTALAHYEKALPLLEDAIRREPGDIAGRTEQLTVYNRIATLQEATGRLPDALRTFQEAIRLGSSAARTNDTSFRLALAASYVGASTAKRNMGDNRGAHEEALACMRLYRDIKDGGPDAALGLAGAYAALGMSQMTLGQLEKALVSFRQGAAAMERLTASDPRNVTWNRELMLAYGHVADVLGNPDLQNLGDRVGALHAYRQAAEVARRLYRGDPADFRAALDYGIVLSRVETVMDDHNLTEKLAVQREALRVLDEATKVSPGDLSLLIYRTLLNQHLGDSLAAGGWTDSAHEAFSKAGAIAEPGLTSGHAAVFVLLMRVNQKLATNAVARGLRAEALRFAERALRLSEHPSAKVISVHAVPRGVSAMGLTYAALLRSRVRQDGDLELARSWLRRAVDAWHAAQADPQFAAPHRREMRDVEAALARIDER